MDLRKVMLVDDDGDIRTIGEMSLARVGGWETRVASCGADALRAAASFRPDLILMDVLMPDMDGLATFDALRAREETARTPVIFLTARVQRHEVAHYLALGGAGVIFKPFDPMTLPAEIRRMVKAE
ncbi:MAG: response regulator [Myxococcaceae bacterium]|nr:response regulator [Myxococcaceae bacterium]